MLDFPPTEARRPRQLDRVRLGDALDETRTMTGEVAAADKTMETTRALTGGRQDFESAMNSGGEETRTPRRGSLTKSSGLLQQGSRATDSSMACSGGREEYELRWRR
jgi:hypothetical protein